MPSALDRGDIDAFFIWEPYGSESLKISGNKVHRLTNGGSYFNGYYLLGAWKWYLRDNPDVAPRLLRRSTAGAITRKPIRRRCWSLRAPSLVFRIPPRSKTVGLQPPPDRP